MNSDFMAANTVSVFLGYLNFHLEKGSTLQDAINGIKTVDADEQPRK